MITRLIKIILSSAFVLCGIAVGIITLNAIIQRGIEFAAIFFIAGSIGMVYEGVKGFKEAKKEIRRSKVLTIRY